ncbi:ArnT family glycosyltransferase [Streptomyces noursei]|uniref:ArnT family glycosyltransferase n=1 Tax=Streptomyces noursei TaxID=1971 RepID=UPI00167A1DD6|nr:glycosyltransferase family 39 protein [Streptomyces noursei]MCZ1014138.1 glycosyltransferase family 39 protein [Streptomyces noursei]GGX24174.1 membrane protein [Streptomyces noursei]
MATASPIRDRTDRRRRPTRAGHARHCRRTTLSRESSALLLILATATVLYAWGIDRAGVHPYYSAAVRSMAADWHAFVFGGLDPSGSITVDKIPGALWPQALSVRLLGPHNWAAVLPQVLEGVLAVGALHRIVRAWAGPTAGLLAALALALTPITVALDRHTIPDTLLVLLLILAAGALQRAVATGRVGPLLLCAAWVGLAFQAKMLQAWLVLPVFAAVYQLAAPGSRLDRARRLLLAGTTALVVSCSWLLLVWATPAADRPYVDGTTNNNPFTLVFGYNGLSRFGHDPHALGAVAGTAASRTTGNTGWTMLVNQSVGPQIAWLLPLAALALALGVWWRAGHPRTDGSRAGFLLWGGWLLIHIVVFSNSNGNHGYYTAVLAPALAALSGAGTAVFWAEYRAGGRRRAALPIAVGVTALWAAVIDGPHSHFAPWLLPVVLMLGLCGAAGLWTSGPRTPRRAVHSALAACLASALLAPAVWAASCLNPRYPGSPVEPLAGPVGPGYRDALHHRARIPRNPLDEPSARDAALLHYLSGHRSGETYLLATQAAYGAEPLLRATSRPMLVMGGFTGLTPYPAPHQLRDLVATHRLRYALLTTSRPSTPATAWVKRSCTRIPPSAYGRASDGSFTLYDCARPGD